ncbi:MAG: ParA family protein, partial [Oscillospiraceae bacterium]
PPALGILTVNAFSAADGIIIPINADIFSLQGIAQLSETIKRIKAYCNPTLKIIGIVLNKYNGRALLSKEVLGAAQMLAEELDTIVFKNTIKMCVAIMEAQTHQKTIFQYSPKNATINDYRQLVSELLENGL